jgi:PD-(D/E)XK nuclease superfamily
VYDYTALSVLLGCEQEFVFRHVRALTRNVTNVSPHFGQAVHAGVRALFDGAPREVVRDAVATSWGEFVAPEKKAHLNLSYAQNVVEQYAETYFGDNAAPFELVLNERYLEWPERGLCGIVDRVVRSKADGQLYVMDLKTTGLYLSQNWFEQWRHSLQAAIYLDLVEHTLDHEVVAGFWVDAIHLDRRGYARKDDFMRVGPFPYSPALRAELRRTVDVLLKRANELERMPEQAVKNPRNCFRFNSLCSYYGLCTLDPSDREDAVKMGLAAGDFVEKRWEPKERA